MARLLRWLGIGLGGLVALLVISAIAVFIISEIRLNRTFTVPDERVVLPTDQASLVRGEHLVLAVAGCTDCHGANLGGRLFLDAGPVGKIYAPNLTRGRGGIGTAYSDADWVRSLRHGVSPSRRGLLIMPSDELNALSDEDLGAIIAYVKSAPAVDGEQPQSQIGPLGRLLYVVNQLPLLAAERIDVSKPRPAAPPVGPTAAYGAYLAQGGGCVGCHGPTLSGGPIPGVPPDIPPAANLTKGGPLAGWTEADFIRALRTGKRPNGSDINPFMPWQATARMTDDEIKALWAYLQTVPAKPTGNR